MTGHAKKTDPVAAEDHVSRPLTSLKDPAQFGPPPKNVNYHGGAAVPDAITPDRRGIGAPLSRHEQQDNETDEGQEFGGKSKPPVPYRADTTGLRTQGLLPPPKPTSIGDKAIESPTTKPKPQLPPRLPPRRNPQISEPSSPPPPYSPTASSARPSHSFLNQDASASLAKKGISVSNLGIGSSSPAQTPSSAQNQSTPMVDGLQNRFGSLSTNVTGNSAQPRSGTTFAQKQAALSTASQLQRDPTKVSATDAREAVGTANDFRERHGEEVSKGWKAGQALNKKYGLAGKVQQYAGSAAAAGSPAEGSASSTSPVADAGRFGAGTGQTNPMVSGQSFKKAPPPPPPMRTPTDPAALRSPPPIPIGSKPR